MNLHAPDPQDRHDRPAEVRRRLPGRPRHRPRGHRRRQPRARTARTRARLRRRGAPPTLRHRGADPLREPASRGNPAGDRRAPTRCSPPATPRRRSKASERRSTSARTVTRVLDDTGEATAFAPLDDEAADWTLERAFETAKARSGRLTSVGVSSALDVPGRPTRRAASGVEVEHVALPEALRRLGAGRRAFSSPRPCSRDTVAEAPRLGGRRRLVASAQLSPAGPGLFTPAQGTTSDLAGQGVADPSPMLLATALLLSEGLGRKAAGVALEESLAAALQALAATARRRCDGRRGDDPRVRRRGPRAAPERAP